jgi:hypothetical protein
MKNFNFRKTIMRNNFTRIFGKSGRRRVLTDFTMMGAGRWRSTFVTKSKIQWHRRAAQGWMNQTFGRLQALKIRLQYGRRKPTRRFIR